MKIRELSQSSGPPGLKNKTNRRCRIIPENLEAVGGTLHCRRESVLSATPPHIAELLIEMSASTLPATEDLLSKGSVSEKTPALADL